MGGHAGHHQVGSVHRGEQVVGGLQLGREVVAIEVSPITAAGGHVGGHLLPARPQHRGHDWRQQRGHRRTPGSSTDHRHALH